MGTQAGLSDQEKGTQLIFVPQEKELRPLSPLVAVMAGISCTQVSQIQKRFDNPDDLHDLPILLPQTQALLKKYEV